MIDKDEIYKEKLQPIAQAYIEANIYENGWVKSQKHFEMCTPLCEYLTGEPYEKIAHSGLRLKLHNITDQITTRLDTRSGCRGSDSPVLQYGVEAYPTL